MLVITVQTLWRDAPRVRADVRVASDKNVSVTDFRLQHYNRTWNVQTNFNKTP
jgi:hypothetical protein